MAPADELDVSPVVGGIILRGSNGTSLDSSAFLSGDEARRLGRRLELAADLLAGLRTRWPPWEQELRAPPAPRAHNPTAPVYLLVAHAPGVVRVGETVYHTAQAAHEAAGALNEEERKRPETSERLGTWNVYCRSLEA